jgi:hypothetical protein
METFAKWEVIAAIEQFLEYGEEQFQKSHDGYFSGQGWAARCLRSHKEQLLNSISTDETSVPEAKLAEV